MSCQLKPDVAYAAVDLGLHIDREDRLRALGPLVLDQEALDVLARRFLAPAFRGRQSPKAAKSVIMTWIGPCRHVSFGGEQVGRSLVLLYGSQAEPSREPVEPAADREATDDRAEMAAAVRKVPFPGPDERMQADRRKINVVGRAAAVDPDGHQAVADQGLGLHQGVRRLRPVRQVGRTIVS